MNNEFSIPKSLADLQIFHAIGKGATSCVYLCHSKVTKMQFALKVVPRHIVNTELAKSRILAEKQSMKEVVHPFIVRLYTTFKDHDNLYFLLEMVNGNHLYHHIWDSKRGRLSEKVTKLYATQIIRALQSLHTQGYCHRDVKSGNILVDDMGNIKLIDFGFAKKIRNSSNGQQPLRTYSFCGTPYIMSPEMIRKEGHGFEHDWWSLGVVIYEMIAGRPPWPYQPLSGPDPKLAQNEYLRSILNQIDSIAFPETLFGPSDGHLVQLIRRLLTENPKKRLGVHGATDVMNHPWFANVDWDVLEKLRNDPLIMDSDSDTDEMDEATSSLYFSDF